MIPTYMIASMGWQGHLASELDSDSPCRLNRIRISRHHVHPAHDVLQSTATSSPARSATITPN